MQPLISVIVTTYNQEKTIGRALESILMQQCHAKVEIVIGEDCSTDGTLAICQAYRKKYPDRILLLANKPNKGFVDNYFDCLFAAHGDYIADCAGDDWWLDPLKLEKEVTLLEAHSEVGIVHTDWQYIDTSTGKITKAPRPVTEEPFVEGQSLLEDILIPTNRPVIHLCTSMYRTAWARKAHNDNMRFFRNKAYNCEDMQLSFFLAKMGKVAYLKDVTLNYSSGGESISNSADYSRLFNFFRKAAQLTFDLAKQENFMTPRITAYLKQKVFELQMDAFRTHNKSMRNEANNLTHKWEVEKTFKILLLKFIMSNALTWHLTLLLRNIVVAVKHKLQ